jgi:hypothetical protein
MLKTVISIKEWAMTFRGHKGNHVVPFLEM